MDLPSEPQQDSRRWYAKKRFIIPLGLAAVLLVSQLGGGQEPVKTLVPATGQIQGIEKQQQAPIPQVAPAPEIQKAQPVPVAPKATPSSGLSNDNYYTNVDGNEVHSPAYSDSVPAGASAQCRDGTYSFSQNRRGTCSGHGGVSQWY